MTTTTPSAQTGTKPTETVEIPKNVFAARTCNITASFKGERAFEIQEEFSDWLKTMIEKYPDLVLMSDNINYNGVWETNRLLTKETK